MKSKHDIIWIDSTDSTNDEVRRRFSELDNLSVLTAQRQTYGRGQVGNLWSSAPGENLTFSIIMKFGDGLMPEVRAIDQFVISKVAALSVVDLLAAHDIEGKIKWPNDIYVENRKICGILIENALMGYNLVSSIIGIGLNVNQTCFDPSLPNPTSIAICSKTLPLPELMEEFMDIFKAYCSRYLNITGGYTRLGRLYLSQLWRINEEHSYINLIDNETFTGIIKGISEVGNIIIEDKEKGELKEFAFKEIGYII